MESEEAHQSLSSELAIVEDPPRTYVLYDPEAGEADDNGGLYAPVESASLSIHDIVLAGDYDALVTLVRDYRLVFTFSKVSLAK